MNTCHIAVAAALITALSACSDDGDSSSPLNDMGMNDTVNTNTTAGALDASNYSEKLSTSLGYFRSEYFAPFTQAPALANQLFSMPLPDATEYFGPNPFPTGAESSACDSDSGNVVRDVTTANAQTLTIQASFDFSECLLQNRVYNGTTIVELDGDAPSRLGGQRGKVAMQFDNMSVKYGTLLNTTGMLTGRYETHSGWAAAWQNYSHEYTTEQYRQFSDDLTTTELTDIEVNNATYSQQYESNYYEPENAYYRLSEFGSMSLTGMQNNMTVDYSVSIDPELVYSSQPGTNDLPVYDDNVLSGTVTFTQQPAGSITVTPSESDAALVIYTINDGLHTFSETNEWLFPIDCKDNSAMNQRNLCDFRR